MGKIDSQSGHRLTLRCGVCKRPLGIFFQQKNISSPAKIVVLDGSVHKTKNETQKIHVHCKCGAKTIFENKSSILTKQGWRRIK
jgi:hypothetical protein